MPLSVGELAHVDVAQIGFQLVPEPLALGVSKRPQKNAAGQTHAQTVTLERPVADFAFVVEASRTAEQHLEDPVWLDALLDGKG